MNPRHFALSVTSVLSLASCSDPDAMGADTAARRAGSEPLPVAWQSELHQAVEAIAAGGAGPGVSLTIDYPSYRPFSTAVGIADLATGQAPGLECFNTPGR